MVEFALILPVFLLFFATTLDLGRLAAAQLTVTNAAKEGAFQATKTPDDIDTTKPCPANADSNLVLCRVQLEAKGSGIASPVGHLRQLQPSGCPTGLGNRVTVTLIGHFQLLTPILSPFFGGTRRDVHPVVDGADRDAACARDPAPDHHDDDHHDPDDVDHLDDDDSTTSTTTTTTTTTTVACTIPSAGFTYTTSPKSGQSPVSLTVVDTTTSPACAITSWFWDWGDNTTSMAENPTPHSYLVKGTYYVTLRVTNAAGTNTTGAVQVTVK